MKNALLIAIVAFSINAFAQGQGITKYPSYPSSILSKGITPAIEKFGPQSNKMTDVEQDRSPGKNRALTLLSAIQLLDSIHNYNWDGSIAGWLPEYKVHMMIYDNHHNLISAEEQKWNGYWWVNSSRATISYNEEDKPTNLLFQTWIGYWENDDQYIYTYDAKNNPTSELYMYWNGLEWENDWLSTFTYDANNHLTSESYQYWQGGLFLNEEKWIYEYDTNNNLVNRIYLLGNGIDWENNYQNVYMYDVNANLVTDLLQIWVTTTWENAELNAYIYDANYHLIRTVDQDWNGHEWVNSYQSTLTYGPNDLLSNSLRQTWNVDEWENFQYQHFTYDINKNRVGELEQLWIENAWKNFYQYLYNYDANNNQTSDLTQRWNDTIWLNIRQLTFLYDANNLLINETYKFFNANGIDIQNGDSTHYFFHTITDTKDLVAAKDYISVSPNPTSGKFAINSAGPLGGIEIYNLSGVSIYSDKPVYGQTSAEIDLTPYGPGIYFVRIYDGVNTYIKKVLLQ